MIDIYVKFQTVHGTTVSGYMHPKAVEVSMEDAKQAMEVLQADAAKKKISWLALYDRDTWASDITEITVTDAVIEQSAMHVTVIEGVEVSRTPTEKKTLVVKRQNEEKIEFHLRTEIVNTLTGEVTGLKNEDNFLGYADHDEHGWSGMEATESLMEEFAEALGIKVIDE